jgi:hypothetical protein
MRAITSSSSDFSFFSSDQDLRAAMSSDLPRMGVMGAVEGPAEGEADLNR